MSWVRTVLLCVGWCAVGVCSWCARNFPTLDRALAAEWAVRRTAVGWYGGMFFAERAETSREKNSGKESAAGREWPIWPEAQREKMAGWQLAVRQEKAESTWGFDLESDSYSRRGSQQGLTTVSPVALMLSQPMDFGFGDNFHSSARMGVGVVHQFQETDDYTESEMRTLLRVGWGAEWTPTEWMLFRLGYEYSLLPVQSTLNPDLPTQDHSVSLGVEFKF